jgi:hypothetical protein
MSWLHFLLWIAGIYLLYYLANIFYDVSIAGRHPPEAAAANELSFIDNHQAMHLEPEADAKSSEGKPAEIKNAAVRSKIREENEIIASRGVTLKNLFNHAREESFIYTKAVSF